MKAGCGIDRQHVRAANLHGNRGILRGITVDIKKESGAGNGVVLGGGYNSAQQESQGGRQAGLF
jgi:hypothetical protein